MKVKVGLLVASMIFAVVSVVGGTVYSKNQISKVTTEDLKYSRKTNAPGSEADNSENEPSQSEIAQKINQLFSNDQQVFLAQDLTIEAVVPLRTQVEKIEDPAEREALEKQLNEVGSKLAIQSALNALFVLPVLNGDTFQKDYELAPNVTEQKISDLKKMVEEQSNGDEFYQQIAALLDTLHPTADSTDQSSDGQESKEKTTITSTDARHAEELVQQIIKDGRMNSQFTMEQYINARDAVKALPEGAEKTTLMQDIKHIQEAMTNMGIYYEE